MMRLAIAFVVLASVASSVGCPSKKGSTTTTGAGSGSGSGSTVYAKKAALSWGIQQGTGSAEIFLAVTDETGRQVSHPIGNFKGTCEVATPIAEMKAIIGLACRMPGAGTTELHAVAQGNEVIVLKLLVQDGETPDAMSRVEVTRVTVPAGAAIVAG
jgi:hypothetical protein